MKVIYRFCLPLLLLISQPIMGATPLPTGAEVRDLMLKNWLLVQDYEVDIKLSVKIPGFRMPARKIHYLYKAPDKSKVEVKGFAIVPKQGLQPFITFLQDSLDLEVLGDTTFRDYAVFQVTLTDTFMNRPGTISMFVDKQTGSVYHVSVSSEKQTFFEMQTDYDEIDGIFLPVETNITMHFPPDFKNIQRLGLKPTDMKNFDATITDEWLEGTISITFKKYQVNQGLPDYLFEQDPDDIIQD